jgi:pimeloyl-ACP methyl ester carboxylesterase
MTSTPTTTPHRATTTYATMAADASGHDDGRRPLVLLHGLTFDRRMWHPVLDELVAVDPGRRVVSLDLPGHGQSAPSPSYDLERVADAVRGAVDAAGLERPVMVGHSIGAFVASIYAALYPTTGVVAVDQSLHIGPFAQFVRSAEPQLRGPKFPAVWALFHASMHAELLPAEAQAIVSETSRPRQDLFLGYQREVLEVPAAELQGRVHVLLAVLRAAGRPYALIAGDSLSEGDRAWLLDRLPQATIEAWSGTGHFPHLAYPRRFAERLAATADWSI